MVLSTHQPYFCPHAGFFLKAHLSDIFVILDSVQFPRGTTWITRNRFKNDQGTLWLTIPVCKKGLGLQPINRVRIYPGGRWAAKHLASFKHAYGHAPYFADHLKFIEEIFSAGFQRLIDMNMAIIRHLLQSLKIKSQIRLLSQTGIQKRGTALLIDICRRMGADTFLTQKSAVNHLDEILFRKEGIQLRYFNAPTPVYPQLWGDFIANLSMFDMVFNCGPKARDILLAG